MAKTDVRAALMAATKITPKSGEEEGALALRVATCISDDVSEENYAKLPGGATAWFEKAVAAIEAGKEFTLPPAMNGATAPAAAAKKAAPAAAKKAPAKKAPAKKVAAPKKKAAAAPKKAAKAPKEKKEPRVSGTRTAIEMICKKPTISLEELSGKLLNANLALNDGLLGNVFRTTRHTLEVLTEQGKL